MRLRAMCGVLAVLVLSTGVGHAKVAPISLTELVAGAECIVVATVERVDRDPFSGRTTARARVGETWRGQPVRVVEYSASPTWSCDVSTAVVGELAILFLDHDDKNGGYRIAHSGHGRMVINQSDGDAVVCPGLVTQPTELRNAGVDRGNGGFIGCLPLMRLRDIVAALLEQQARGGVTTATELAVAPEPARLRPVASFNAVARAR
jgi:hypothetical protein